MMVVAFAIVFPARRAIVGVRRVEILGRVAMIMMIATILAGRWEMQMFRGKHANIESGEYAEHQQPCEKEFQERFDTASSPHNLK